MDLSIIIVNWNTRDLLVKSLDSVFDTIKSCEFEVFVVDNGSSDGSSQMVREKYPTVRLIENTENLGFAKANNQAIQKCLGQYILLLNSDAVLQKETAAILLQSAQAHPEAGIFGPRLVFPDGKPQRSFGPLPTFLSEVLSLIGLDKRWREDSVPVSGVSFVVTGYVDGACQLIRRRMVEEIGAFDDNFYLFSEEIDLCWRAHQAGWGVLHVPEAEVVHMGGGSTSSSAKRILLLYRGKLLYFKKHHGRTVSKNLLAVMRITSWVKAKIYGYQKRNKTGLEGKEITWQTVSK